MSPTVRPVPEPSLVPGPLPLRKLWAALVQPGVLTALLLLAGVGLRLAAYLANRSLWVDEAMLASSIIARSLGDLFKPLDFDQASPFGFVFAEWLFVQTLGASEWALRLFPLLLSLASLALFARLARRLLAPTPAVVAVALFAFTPSLIYYGSEVKQYSSDVFCCLLLTVLAFEESPAETNAIRSAFWAVLGAVTIWLSHPAVFVLAGIGAVAVLDAWRRKRHAALVRVLLVSGVWLLSFAGHYWLALRPLSQNHFLASYWADRFVPIPPHELGDLAWLANVGVHAFHEPVGLALHDASLAGVGVLLFALGILAFWRHGRYSLALLTAPFGFLLVASALHRYPIADRLLLFAVPALVLITARGIAMLNHRPVRWLAIALLLFGPVMMSTRNLVQPRTVEEMKPVLAQVRRNWREGDAIYVYSFAAPAFRYYAPRYGFRSEIVQFGACGREDWDVYERDVKQLCGRGRVWILFAHARSEDRRFYLHCLDRVGVQREAHEAPGASAYLYEL